MNSSVFEFSTPTRIIYGPGSSVKIGEEAQKTPITRAMIVTDRGVRGTGMVADVEKNLATAGISSIIFDGVEEDADVNVMHRIAVSTRENKCDGVVVVGGGSPICAAKGAAVEATNNVSSVRELVGISVFEKPPLPILCLPTTAGSGSDVVAGSPVYDLDNKRHLGLHSESLAPRVSILDPVLLESCPFKPMVYAGVDALTHAIEALWGSRATVCTDMFAFESIRLVMTNLRQAVFTSSLESKLNQHLASAFGMISGQAGLGLLHGIAVAHFSYSGAHGYRCGVLLPWVMEYNMPAVMDKFARAAIMLGESDDDNKRDLALAFIRCIKELLVDLQFPRKFENETVQTTPAVVKEVMEYNHSFLQNNIRKVTPTDVAAIFNNAVKGWEI